MPIDNTLSVTTAAGHIAQRILEDMTEANEPDDAASFAQGLQDGLEAAVTVSLRLGLSDAVTPAAAELLLAMERTLRFRLGLS